MTAADALEIADYIIRNDVSLVGPLLALIGMARQSRGDPNAEADVDDVMKHLYTKTEHCDKALEDFISQQNQTRLAA